MPAGVQPLGIDAEAQQHATQEMSSTRRRAIVLAVCASLGLALGMVAHFASGGRPVGAGRAAKFAFPGLPPNLLHQQGRLYDASEAYPRTAISGGFPGQPSGPARLFSPTFSGQPTLRSPTELQSTAVDDIDTHGSVMTLSRYMIEQARESEDMQEMESLMTSIQFATKTIASLVARAGIQDLTGLEGGGGSVNVQGEEQKKLDVIANTVMKNALRYSGKVGVVGSEEEEEPVLVEETYNGRYAAVFDPLDGSSNVDAAISTGTIFGVYDEGDSEGCVLSEEDQEGMTPDQLQCLTQTLQPGKRLVAAGYCMYSSSTIMVLTLGSGVNGFTLDPNIGEFVLTHPNIKMPKRGKIYSINEANEPDWNPTLREYISNLKRGKGESGEKYSARYIGSMVGDIHRTLLYGGIFGYPGDAQNPNGKLRLVYEGAPMSFIIEQAGGKSTTGSQRVMDISPKDVHQRVPVFLGSPDDIDEVTKLYEKAGLKTEY
mmetsp:Transcript_51022/g.143619  ORF Transcript_51022/g.143619 Transcript_51022/m.143619 type:complete len:487 (+) Transcript_51022:87-1547(+)